MPLQGSLLHHLFAEVANKHIQLEIFLQTALPHHCVKECWLMNQQSAPLSSTFVHLILRRVDICFIRRFRIPRHNAVLLQIKINFIKHWEKKVYMFRMSEMEYCSSSEHLANTSAILISRRCSTTGIRSIG